MGVNTVASSSKMRIWCPKSLRVRDPGKSCVTLVVANVVSQKMWRLVVGSHQQCEANWEGRLFRDVSESRWKMRGRPQ